MNEYDSALLYFGGFCLVIHHVISPILSAKLFPKYCDLPWAMRMEWNSRVVSSLHAIITSLMATYALIIDTQLWSYPIYGSSHVGKITLGISTGYMISDIISMPIYWRGKELYIYIFHHGLSALAFYISMKYEVLIFFALFRLCSEYSTPFANQRWFYQQYGYDKKTPEAMFTTIMFSLFFFLSRNISIPVYWNLVIRASRSPHFMDLLRKFPIAFAIWMSASIFLDVLNVHWGRKIVPKGIKTTTMIYGALMNPSKRR